MSKISNETLFKAVITFQEGVLRNAERMADLALAANAAVLKVDAVVESCHRLEARVDSRLAGMDQRLTDMDQRLADMDQRLADMDQRMDQRFERMDQRFERMDGKLDQMMLILAELRHPTR